MAENNSSAPLLPCPFCGERTQINALGRRWWRMESGHRQDCLLSEVDHTVSQTDEQKQLLIDAWNTRAPQAVAAQAAPAAVAVPYRWRDFVMARLMQEGVIDHDGDGLYVCSGDAWGLINACMSLYSATPALPATEDSSAGDLAEVQAEPVALQMCSELRPRTESEKAAYLAGVADGRMYAERDADTAPQAQPADALDAAFEAVRKRFCKLPRYSFLLDGKGNVRRVPSFTGNWVEFEAAHTLFDPVAVDAAMAAAQEGGNAAKEA